MKRKSSKLMALALTLAAVCAMVTISASAATTYTPIGGSTNITKNLVVDEDANIPDITFAYTIQRGTAAPAGVGTIEILSSEVTATIGSAAYTNADTATTTPGLPTDADPSNPTAGKKYAQKTVNVTFPNGSFTKPGVYRYVITETNSSLPGVIYDTNPTRYLDVFVVADPSTNALTVNSYALRDSASTISTEGAYNTEPDVKSGGYTNTITQYDFSFSKTIGGNQGDKNKRFSFTLNISGANPGTYPITSNDVTGTPSSITVQSDGTATAEYSLTDGSSIQVLGLNAGASCTVSENAQDYTPTHSIDGAAAVSGNSAIVLADANHSVAFTNTRNGVIPTGVLLTVAPFTIGLFLFGAAGVYFVARKRQFDED